MTPEVLQVLAQGLAKSLYSLDISECNKVGAGDAIVAFSGLTELNLSGMDGSYIDNSYVQV